MRSTIISFDKWPRFFLTVCFLSMARIAEAGDIPSAADAGPSSGFDQFFKSLNVPQHYRSQFLLLHAASRGDRNLIERLLAAGTDVNTTVIGNRTPLSIATESGNKDVVSLLLRHGANPNLGDVHGVTPLFVAVEKGNAELISLLLRAGSDANAVTHDGYRPLLVAVRSKKATGIQLLLEHGADSAARDANGQTALWITVELGDAQSTAWLLKHGAIISGFDVQGRSLLTLAVQKGKGDLIRLLVSYGMTANKPDVRGRLPLVVAATNRNASAVQALMESGADVSRLEAPDIRILLREVSDWADAPSSMVRALMASGVKLERVREGPTGYTPLHDAASRGAVGVIAAMLDGGADPGMRNREGSTPLHIAAYNGHVAASELLLSRGPQLLNSIDHGGHTALYMAALANRPEVVKLLLARKADTEKTDTMGEGGTALFIAADKGHIEVVRLLLAAGAKPNAPTNTSHRTPIFGATAKRTGIASLLLRHGANINVGSVNGRTPLIEAACYVWPRDKETIQLFLEHGADPRQMDGDGAHALACAASDGSEDIGRRLLARGTEPDMRKDGSRDTALMAAVRKGHIGFVKLLMGMSADVNRVREISQGVYESALDIALSMKNPLMVSLLKENGAKRAQVLPRPARSVAAKSVPSVKVPTQSPIPKDKGQIQLEVFSANGNSKQVQELLEKGIRPNSEALLSAARFGRENVIRLLVKHGADVNAADPFFGQTPLAGAVSSNSTKAIEALLELGANPDNGGPRNTRTPLAEAIFWDRPAIVEALLKGGANPNLRAEPGSSNAFSETPLSIAIDRRRHTLIDLLLRYRADPNLPDRNGQTPLHLAISSGDERIVRALIAAGAQIDTANRYGVAPIDTAIQIGKPALIELLLGSAGVDAGSTPRSRTELLSFAMTGALARHDPAAVAALLRLGANPNARHPQLGVPLLPWDMSSANSRETARLLLESGANPDSIRGDGSSALLLAIDNSFYDLADLMIRKGANPALINDHGSYPLLRAVERGQFELVKSMRSRGASLDIQDAHGLTALMRLAGDGREREVVALCDLGTNPDVISLQGETALILATRSGKKDVVRQLASRTKKIDQMSGRGYAALHEAIISGDADIIRILLEAGAYTESPTREGLTPLMLAARENKPEIIRLLLARNADVRARSHYRAIPHDYSLGRYVGQGKTALMFAATKGSIEIADLLLKKSADVNAQDDDGNTTLIMAVGNGNRDLIRNLLAAGAKPSLRNKIGISAVDLAKHKGATDILSMLAGRD